MMSAHNESCSFCGRFAHETAWLARGPEVAICCDCIELILEQQWELKAKSITDRGDDCPIVDGDPAVLEIQP